MKNLNFFTFFLMVSATISTQITLSFIVINIEKKVEKKLKKKVIFIFANFFFKIVFGHFFYVQFQNKKKVLKTPSFSIFSTFFYY
jgi:hypothetical protein